MRASAPPAAPPPSHPRPGGGQPDGLWGEEDTPVLREAGAGGVEGVGDEHLEMGPHLLAHTRGPAAAGGRHREQHHHRARLAQRTGSHQLFTGSPHLLSLLCQHEEHHVDYGRLADP